MKNRRLVLAIGLISALIASLLGLFSGCGAAEEAPGTLTVGVSVPMSGPVAAYGLAFDRGYTLAVEDINAKGGVSVGGKKYLITKKSYDNTYDPAKTVEITRRMVEVDKVFMIGSHGLGVVKPVIPYTEQNKIIFMGVAGGKDVKTFMPEKYFFQNVVGPPEVQYLLWDWLGKNRTDIKAEAELRPDDATGQAETQIVQEEILPKYGVKPVAREFFKSGTTDFYPVLTKVMAAKPDVINFGGSTADPDKGRIAKQAREMGYKGLFVGHVTSTGLLIQSGGANTEGMIFAGNIDPQSSFATKEEKGFYDNYVARWTPWDDFSLMVTNGAYIVAQAIEKANSLDPDKVAEVIHTQKFNVLGREVFFGGLSVYGQPARQIITPMAIYTIKDGKPQLLTTTSLPAGY